MKERWPTSVQVVGCIGNSLASQLLGCSSLVWEAMAALERRSKLQRKHMVAAKKETEERTDRKRPHAPGDPMPKVREQSLRLL